MKNSLFLSIVLVVWVGCSNASDTQHEEKKASGDEVTTLGNETVVQRYKRELDADSVRLPTDPHGFGECRKDQQEIMRRIEELKKKRKTQSYSS